MTGRDGTSLAGRRILVVGASSGIGLATARLLASAGAEVHGAARRRIEREPFASSSLDARDRAGAARLVARLAPLDGLVYASGTNVPERALERLAPADWDELIAVNLTGAFNLVKAALPQLRARRGDVVLVASVSGQWPDVTGPAYQASKAGLIGFARACGVEEHQHGVRFSVVSPGLVDTPILERRPAPVPAEVLELALRPEDVAQACLFMLSLPSRAHVPELTILPAALQALGKSSSPNPPPPPG